MTYEERFWAKVDKSGDCWLWTAYRNHRGYGSYHGPDGRRTTAHRIAWLLSGRAIPEGLTLDHLCRVRACVNPAHMEPVTIGENSLRGTGLQAVNAAKTTCPKGHALDGQRGDGSRYCLTCNRERNLRYYRSHPEKWRGRYRTAALDAAR